MPEVIAAPTRVLAAGNKPKSIDEYVGRVNSGTAEVSIDPNKVYSTAIATLVLDIYLHYLPAYQR